MGDSAPLAPDHDGGAAMTTSHQHDTPGVEVVRSEERLVAGVERRVSGAVRVGKRIVTEQRTVTVTVRREELFVEHVGPREGAPLDGAPPAPRDTSEPVVTLTLHEEEPVVSTRTVPREVVRVFVDRTRIDVPMTASVAREVVAADVVHDGDDR